MRLKEFLNFFDFEYVVFNEHGEKELGLIDTLGGNLGDIENERFPYSREGIIAIIDRLEIYENDYIFDYLKDLLQPESVSDDWSTLFQNVSNLGLIKEDEPIFHMASCVLGLEELVF